MANPPATDPPSIPSSGLLTGIPVTDRSSDAKANDAAANSDDSSWEASTSEDVYPVSEISSDDGDTILVLTSARLRVCSAILCSASPVFKVMLGPKFSEGQDLRNVQNPKEISLPDDDTAAMTRLCRLIHHQHDPQAGEPHEFAAKALFDLTVLMDKYACTAALSMAWQFLLSSFATPLVSSTLSAETLLYLAAAANLLDNRRYFCCFTRRLVLNATKSYSSLVNHPAVAMLPSSVLRKSQVLLRKDVPF